MNLYEFQSRLSDALERLKVQITDQSTRRSDLPSVVGLRLVVSDLERIAKAVRTNTAPPKYRRHSLAGIIVAGEWAPDDDLGRELSSLVDFYLRRVPAGPLRRRIVWWLWR